MKLRQKTIFILLFMLCMAPLIGVTRVSFTHPGYMMKIPTTFIKRSPYLFTTGFTSEIHNFSPFNTTKGVFFSMDVSDRFTLGFSSGQGGDTTAVEKLLESTFVPPVEFGFHTQYKIFVRQDMSVSIGLHDIIFENDTKDGLRLDPKQLSFFAAVGSEKEFGEYSMNTYMGFGTGGFSVTPTGVATGAVQSDTTEQSMGAGVFAGIFFAIGPTSD